MILSLVAAVVALSLSIDVIENQSSPSGPKCDPPRTLVKLPQIPEANGIAASRRLPDRLWAHKDSGEPVLFALDTRGTVVGQMKVPGAHVDDWEAIAVGSCRGGSCIYIGDIGDNNARRDHITIYRFPEPGTQLDAPTAIDTFQAQYPDGAQDAEALLVAGDGRLFVVTKGETGPVALYEFPGELRAGSTVRLQRVGEPRERRKPEERDRVTDGSVSPDGKWIVLRTSAFLKFYRAADLLAGNWQEASNIDLRPLGEPQGEGVTFAGGGMIYLIGEGGKEPAGTFARLSCK